MTLADRATIANMGPEYGATCGFFPVDAETLNYLTNTGRKTTRVELVEKYAKAQGLFRTKAAKDPVFTDTIGTRPWHRRAIDGRSEAAGRARAAGRRSGRFCRRDGNRIQEGR